MVAKIKSFLALYGLYAQMDLAWLLRDTRFALLAILSDMCSELATMMGFVLLAWRFDGIGGMSRYEVLFMMGYSMLVSGLFFLFFAGNNTGHISRRIGRGQLEHMMIQPRAIPVQLLAEGFLPVTGCGPMLLALFVMGAAIHGLGIPVTFWWIMSVLGNAVVTVFLILTLSYLFSSLTFYFPVAAEEISTDVLDATWDNSRVPLGGMPRWLQIPLITVIPSGLMAWFPSMALLGRAPFGWPAAFPLFFTLILAALAAFLFMKGWRYYAQRGCNRYSTMGHRR